MKSLLSQMTFMMTFILLSSVEAKTVIIKIELMKFTPATAKASVGDTVQWDNKDFFPHTVTALDRSFDSKSIASMTSWSLKTKKRGTYKYKCLFHPVMFGTLIIE